MTELAVPVYSPLSVDRRKAAVVDVDMTLSDDPRKDWLAGHLGADQEALATVRGFAGTMGYQVVFISNRLRAWEPRADAFLMHHNLLPGAPLYMADALTPASIRDATHSKLARVSANYDPVVGFAFHDDVAEVMEARGMFVVRPPILDRVQ